MKFLKGLILILFFISCNNNGNDNNYNEEESEDIILDPQGTQYATWIMIWNRSSEDWWNPYNTVGATILVNNRWQAINWMDKYQVEEHVKNMREAGVTILICDLTNGWNWLNNDVHYIQSLCVKNGMKVCIAENSYGDVSMFESHAYDVWHNFAKPDSPYGSTYLRKEGEPVIVCYGIREWYNAYKSSNGDYAKKFNLVWASGEDSDINKWGWQLEPWIGSVPSQDAMFVTSSIKWGVNDEDWRKSLAFLDYNFLLAKQNHPKYIIIGGYDDIHERNGWLPANTFDCIPGRQMRDKNGVISVDAYYSRVKEWISGTPTSISGGYITDGCYRIISKANGKIFNHQGNKGKIGPILIRNAPSDEGLADYYWFYHLGNNNYRIISVSSGLSLDLNNESPQDDAIIIHNLDGDTPTQKWILEDAGNGCFFIKNNFSGKVLQIKEKSDMIIQSVKNEDLIQKWKIEKIVSIS